MSQLERLKEQKPDARSRKSKLENGEARGNLVSFNPSDEQKLLIKTSTVPLTDVLLFFESMLQDGHKLSAQYQAGYDCYSIIVRDGESEWSRAIAVSTWHRSFETAIRTMHYALSVEYPDFPLGVRRSYTSDLDW